MSRRALLLLLALVLWALPAVSASASASAGWRLPVAGGRGAVVGTFQFDRAHAYARGWRRGIDLRAPPGSVVRAPCSGRVTFAGAVPGRSGAGVSLRCGAWLATVLGLSRSGAVRGGGAVLRGVRLGVAGGAGVVRLGARRRGERHGYADPLALVGGREVAPPPPAVGPPPSRWEPPRAVGARRARAQGPAAPVRAPVAAWLGAALLAGGLGAGVTRRRAARRVVSARPCPSTSPRRSTT
jgi:hypothetical protein